MSDSPVKVSAILLLENVVSIIYEQNGIICSKTRLEVTTGRIQ